MTLLAPLNDIDRTIIRLQPTHSWEDIGAIAGITGNQAELRWRTRLRFLSRGPTVPGPQGKGFIPQVKPVFPGCPPGTVAGPGGGCVQPGASTPIPPVPPQTVVPQVTQGQAMPRFNVGSAPTNQGIFSTVVGIGQTIFGGGGPLAGPGLGGNRGQGLGGSAPSVPSLSGCAPGFSKNAQGICQAEGFGGVLQRALPFGQTGTQADVFGEAVIGAMGIPALVPAQHQHLTSHCPPGSILGRDNLCYRKGSIPPTFRKWRPGPKPFLSGGDVKCLRKADRLRKSKGSKRLLRQLGMG